MALYNSKNPNFKNWILCILLCFLPLVWAQPPPPPDNLGITRIKPSMIVIMVVLVCTFFFLGFFSIYIRRCSAIGLRTGHFNGSFSFGRLSRPSARGLDPELIESFPAFPYSAVKNFKIGKSTLECAVCLNEFEDEEMLRLIPHCNHVFHPECIETWLISHTTCPVCRADLLTPCEDISGENFPSSNSGPETRINVEEPRESEHTLLPAQVKAASEATDSNKTPPQPPRSKSARWKLSGLLPRSYSTGHSLISPAGDPERFTLRLPQEVRKELIRSGSTITVSLPRAASSRRGIRRSKSGGGGRGSGRYERLERAAGLGPTRTPPLSTRSGPLPKRAEVLGSTVTPPLFTKSGSGRSSGSTVEAVVGPPPQPNQADGSGSTLTPSLIPRSVSVRFQEPAGSDQVVAVDAPPRRLVKSVTSPNFGLLAGRDEAEDGSSPDQGLHQSQI